MKAATITAMAVTATATKAPPRYDPLLRAFHRAFAPELRRIIDDLPLSGAARILDLCCGDGFYSELLARRLDESGELTLADRNGPYLERARRRLATKTRRVPFRIVSCDARYLPFDEAAFDLVWCAQSFISLDDPLTVVKEMRRVVRPGGFVAILESDELHHLLLPWPVELEIAVESAAHASFRARYGAGAKAAPARRLGVLLRQAGLKARRKKTYAADRQAPFSLAVERFLRRHVRFLRKVVRPHLKAADWQRFVRFTDAAEPASIFRRRDADLTCLNVLYVARRVD